MLFLLASLNFTKSISQLIHFAKLPFPQKQAKDSTRSSSPPFSSNIFFTFAKDLSQLLISFKSSLPLLHFVQKHYLRIKYLLKNLPFHKKVLPLQSNAQMAESVDALVSNTSGAIRPGSTPGLGTTAKS